MYVYVPQNVNISILFILAAVYSKGGVTRKKNAKKLRLLENWCADPIK